MADTFRITGLNNILFDSGPTGTYKLQSPVEGMSRPVTRARTLAMLSRFPQQIRSHILGRHPEYPMSIISFEFDIDAASGTAMEDAVHDLQETLQDTLLYFSTRGARGTEAVLEFKKSGASATSYKSIFYGEVDEAAARTVEAVPMMDHELRMMRLTLYCEAYWRPSSTTNLVNASTVYNHDDADSGHDNYVAIAAANIKGDVEAPTRLIVEFDVQADNTQMEQVFLGRRTRGTPSSFVAVHEGEGFATKSNWASAAETKCSGGNKVSNSANTAGHVRKDVTLDANNRGVFHCYARLKTDDITNTKFRVESKLGGIGLTNDWTYLAVANKWLLADLGKLYWDPLVRSGITEPDVTWTIEYEKDASDLAELDYVLLLPADESALWLDDLGASFLVDHAFVISEVADFPYMQIEQVSTTTIKQAMSLKGGFLKLQPNAAHRIYFVANTDDLVDIVNEVHGTTTDLQMKITIDYLPQYISPLE